MHKFSVIMPLYNKAPYVRKALESIINQTYKGWELVVVDDGSTDDSYVSVENVLLKWGKENIKLVKQTNAGVGATRNFGVELAKNEFICFLDADDWWEPEFLAEMDNFVNNYPEAYLFATDYYYVKNNKKKVVFKTNTGYINYCKVYSESCSMPVWTGAVCVRKTAFDKFGGFPTNIKLGEDFCLWIKIALNYKVAFLNKTLSNYNQDVNVNNRLTRHLHKPEHNMLFNLSDLESYEKSCPDYKRLIDKLRINGLLDYYIDSRYREYANNELKKIDWRVRNKKEKELYNKPIAYLKLRKVFFKFGSWMKQMFFNLFI